MLLLETVGHHYVTSVEKACESMALQLEAIDVFSLPSEVLIIRDVTDLRHPPKENIRSGARLFGQAVEVVLDGICPRRGRPQNPLRRTSKYNPSQVYIDVNDPSWKGCYPAG
jgi:hypothetical protein